MFSDQFIFIDLFYIKYREKNTKNHFFKRNVNGDPKDIGLENICIKILCEKKTINFFDDFFYLFFFIFHKSDIKIFLKWFINNYSKGTH